MTASFVGVDVSKATLDVHALPGPHTWQFDNTPAGHAALVAAVAPLGVPLLVLEATGGLEVAATAALVAAGVPVAVVNPRQARDFAKAVGRTAKTDALDAEVLARFAQAVRPDARPLPDPAARAFADLLARRRQLVERLTAERNRLAGPVGDPVARDIRAHVAWLRKRLGVVEGELREAVRRSDDWRAKDALLRSIPGVGEKLALTLLAELPELGTRTREQVASLAGLAPRNRDSGVRRGRRGIGGGRSAVRSALSLAGMALMRSKSALGAFGGRLKAAGKAGKVAVIAVARKRLTVANAVLRTKKRYDPAFGVA